MVPNRRLREELARADKVARKRRTTFDEQATVVPQEEMVPEATRPGRLRDLAEATFDSDSSIELSTSDIDISDLSADGRPVPAAPRTNGGLPGMRSNGGLPGMRGPSLPSRNPSRAAAPAPRGQIVVEPQKKRGAFDFGDDDATRIDPRVDPKREPDVSMMTTEERPAGQRPLIQPAMPSIPLSAPAAAAARASMPAAPPPQVIQARKLPLDEYSAPPPSQEYAPPADEFAAPSQTGRTEKSVVSRIVKSVVAALPSALRKAVDKTGAHSIPNKKRGNSIAERVDEARPREPRADERAWREMRTSPIFDGLPNEALRDALMSGDAMVMRLSRDSLVPLDKPAGGSVCLVRSGQVALARFNEEALAEERKAAAQSGGGDQKLDKKERKRRNQVGPLIRVAEQNLATFEEGDVVETSVGAAMHNTLAVYTVAPSAVITIARARVDLWRRIYPFMADRFRRAAAAARAKVEATDGARSAVADFFIRHGLSVSATLRVRKLDACIECKACEKACEDRYGVKRLSINGRILGNLDFVDACHTCTDARCIDPCNFDAISYDAQRKEILIKEDACTGCTMCATACPYNAIEMHELDDAPLLKLRLQKDGKLGFGDGTPRKAKLRRIASKCDHCAFYNDQACITACPTGALLEILPSDAVTQMPEQARASAKAGFDRTVAIDVNNVNQASAFAKGGMRDLPDLGRARAKRGKMSLPLWWSIAIGAFVLACVEIALRIYLPRYSIAYVMATLVDGIDPDLALSRVDYRPGCELAVNFGYLGTGLMLLDLIYVWRRRVPWMRNVGSLQTWFEWHVLTGVMGPLFIILHSVAKLDNWVSLGVWSMILTVVSGLLGRYMATQVEERASTAAVEVLDLDRKLAVLRASHPGVRGADVWYEAYRRRIANFERALGGKDAPPTFFGALRSLWFTMKDDLLRGSRVRALRAQLVKTVHGKGTRKVRKQAVALAHRLALMERRRVLLPQMEPLFNQWKSVHIPMSVILTVIASIHIVIELRR